MSKQISGSVDRVYFTSAKFCAGALVGQDGVRVRFRGPFCVSEGDSVTLTGQWKSDPKYGDQFDAKSVTYDLPETPEGLVQYLAKHPAFVGIGESTARKIVQYVSSAEHLDRVIRQDVQELNRALRIPKQTLHSLREAWIAIVHLGNGVWEGTAHYVKWKSESQYSFDTGGGTQHVTQSIVNVGKYAATGFTAPDFMGAIGVTDDRVEGTDITVPVFNFTETHYIEKALVTGAYKLALFNLTGKVNGSGFKGFAKGEVLFLGASGSKRGLDDWEITFRFAASPNVVGLSLGSITGISKEGWQYLWVRFIDDEDPTAKALIKRPVSAYVEQVYSYGDFSNLGIGV